MYLLIIFGVIVFIFLYFVWKDANMRSCPEDFYSRGATIIFVAALIYGATIGIARGSYAEQNSLNTYEYNDLPISSLVNKDQYGVHGAFILGTGSFSGNSYSQYITYGNFSQGLKRLELSATSYYIKETDSKKPCIPNYYKIQVKKSFESKWFWDRKSWTDSYMRKNYDAKTIIVPTNTVYKEFSIRD